MLRLAGKPPHRSGRVSSNVRPHTRCDRLTSSPPSGRRTSHFLAQGTASWPRTHWPTRGTLWNAVLTIVLPRLRPVRTAKHYFNTQEPSTCALSSRSFRIRRTREQRCCASISSIPRNTWLLSVEISTAPRERNGLRRVNEGSLSRSLRVSSSFEPSWLPWWHGNEASRQEPRK